jgi:methionine-rich copper-binding protein CopC
MKAAKARRGAARLLAFAALILIGFAPVQRAPAHASLISSQPEDGAVLRESPERFILIFNGSLNVYARAAATAPSFPSAR